MSTRRACLIGLTLAAASVAAGELKPARRLSEIKPAIDLERQVPLRFGRWQVDRAIVPIQPAPDVQARLDVLYTQTLARTYVSTSGERVMLSIAYGSDQGSEATAVHRPEFCYTSQGFNTRAVGDGIIHLSSGDIPIRKLVARSGRRIEPITYWVTLDETGEVFFTQQYFLRCAIAGPACDGGNG